METGAVLFLQGGGMKKKNCTYIGGQAVIQGVMMRGKRGMATAVRDDHGEVQLEARRIKPPEKRSVLTRVPFLRGVINFAVSLFVGMKAMLRSADVAVADDETPSKFEKWMAERWKISLSEVISWIAVILGVVIALGLFMFLPQYFTDLISKAVNNEEILGKATIWYNLIEGGFRILIFIAYILLTLLMRSVRETYCYHGAEHKTINCYEHGMELTVENVKSCSRVHDRCGTTFTFIVLLISIFCFSLVNWLGGAYLYTGNRVGDFVIRLALKLVLLPVVSGISYEILKFFAKIQSPIVLPFKAPGYLLQMLTTREPTDEMIECAIAAFEKVVDMDADPESPEKTFATETKLSRLSAFMYKTFEQKGIDKSDAEWILSLTLDVPRSKLSEERVVTRNECKKVLSIFEERMTGKPLWYIFGDTSFYGYTIKVDERVLIPRPETEILVQQAVRTVEEGDKVLDLCTGSGAVAIALACEAAKDKNITVIGADISDDAIELAKENARINKANVSFVKSDLFEGIRGRFNLITANPPYIPSAEIETLPKEVRDFEPRLALDGGADGLDFYRKIAEKLPRYLVHGGMLIVECGENQAQDILKIFTKCDYAMVVKDLEGKERIVKIVL